MMIMMIKEVIILMMLYLIKINKTKKILQKTKKKNKQKQKIKITIKVNSVEHKAIIIKNYIKKNYK